MENWPDVTNGTFELLGALAIFGHVYTLWRDKAVAGVSILATWFFTLWGFWNLFYYPHLDQWYSFAGGVAIVIGNCFWIGGMVYYSKYPGGKGNVGN